MSTLSVPLTPALEKALEKLIADGVAETKAAVMRKALTKFAEEQAIFEVLEAEREAVEGKVLRGDLDELAKKV